MTSIERGAVIEGASQALTNPGPPSNGTSEVQSIAITGAPTGGTFTLSFGGFLTAALPFNATAAQVQAALVALSSINAGGVVCAGGALPGSAISVTFGGNLALQDVQAIVASGAGLTGGAAPAVAVTTPTPGVNATARNSGTGQVVSDTTNGVLYENKGVPGAPNWTKVGTDA